MDKIFVSQEGYLKFQGEAIRNTTGDGWHDNFAFEDAVREERRLSNELQKTLYITLLMKKKSGFKS